MSQGTYSREEVFFLPYEYNGNFHEKKIVISGETMNRNTNTPDRVIDIGGLLKCSLSQYSDHNRLLYLEYGISCDVNPDVTNPLQPAGSVKLANIILVIPRDSAIPTLVQYMRKKVPIDKISIKDIGWSGGDQTEIRSEHVFGKNYIIDWRPGFFCDLFVIRAEEWLLKVSDYNQSDATPMGSNEDKFNVRTGDDSVTISASAGGGGGGGI
jgi:hypothetical protein